MANADIVAEYPSSLSDDEDNCSFYGHSRPMNVYEQIKRQRLGQSYSLNYDLFALNNEKTLYQRDVKGHTGCVNAVEFNKDGGDDLRVFVWDAKNVHSGLKPQPLQVMKSTHASNIFTLTFSKDNKRVFSAGNDGILIVHDVETGNEITSFDGSCFYSISLRGDDNNVVAAATDTGRIYFFDTRQSPNDPAEVIRERGEIYCVSFNPREPHYLVSCNKLNGLGIFDMRNNKDFFQRAKKVTKRTIFASWDSRGENLFCIRSGSTPYYLNTNKEIPLVCNDPQYSNNITIKSCDFYHDKYGFTGSDDWNIYCWRIPSDYDDNVEENKQFVTSPETDSAFTVLKGHRSIINHVRHSPSDDILISSGVEKIIKVWAGFELPESVRDPPRRQKSTARLSFNDHPNDIEEDEETLRMFDSYTSSIDDVPSESDEDIPLPSIGRDDDDFRHIRRRLERHRHQNFVRLLREIENNSERRIVIDLGGDMAFEFFPDNDDDDDDDNQTDDPTAEDDEDDDLDSSMQENESNNDSENEMRNEESNLEPVINDDIEMEESE